MASVDACTLMPSVVPSGSPRAAADMASTQARSTSASWLFLRAYSKRIEGASTEVPRGPRISAST